MTASFLARLTHSINGLWTDRPRRTGLVLTVSSAGLLMLAAVLATVLTFRVDEATDWVEHTYKVRGLAGQAIQSLQDAEIALSDHILSPTSELAPRLSRRMAAPVRQPRGGAPFGER